MHKAKIVKIHEAADGILAVHVRCCGNVSSESVLTIHQLDRPIEVIDQEIAEHVANVEKQHAARDFVKAHIERLCPSR